MKSFMAARLYVIVQQLKPPGPQQATRSPHMPRFWRDAQAVDAGVKLASIVSANEASEALRSSIFQWQGRGR